jgi:hypothetical protein
MDDGEVVSGGGGLSHRIIVDPEEKDDEAVEVNPEVIEVRRNVCI